jgi:hypothetical protein
MTRRLLEQIVGHEGLCVPPAALMLWKHVKMPWVQPQETCMSDEDHCVLRQTWADESAHETESILPVLLLHTAKLDGQPSVAMF